MLKEIKILKKKKEKEYDNHVIKIKFQIRQRLGIKWGNKNRFVFLSIIHFLCVPML